MYSPYNTWPLGCTVQSVSLPLTFLSECSYSNPLKEPFWSLCGRPSHCLSLFSRLAALCLLSVSACPSWEPYHYLSMRCLINEPEHWRLHPLAFKAIFSRSFPIPLHQLSSNTRTPLTEEWKHEGGLSVPSPYPHFISRRVFAVSILYLVFLHWWSQDFRFLRKREKGKSEICCHLISFAPVSRVSGFSWGCSGEVKRPVVIPESANRRDISRRFSHFHTVCISECKSKGKDILQTTGKDSQTKNSCHITKVNLVYLSV